MPKFRFEPLDKRKHDRETFRCGNIFLDDYLKRQAAQDAEKRIAAVMVLTPDERIIAGYYTLSQHALDQIHLPENLAAKLRLPKYPQLPSALLGRLARSIEFKGIGLGGLLLMGALERSLQLSKSIASMAVTVDAIDDQARDFYLQYGFVPLANNSRRLFLLMSTISQMFRK